MNVWPPEQLWKTILAPILISPIVAFYYICVFIGRFFNNEVVSFGDLVQFFGFIFLSLIALGLIIYFLVQLSKDILEDDQNSFSDRIITVIASIVIFGYPAISFVLFILLKAFYKY